MFALTHTPSLRMNDCVRSDDSLGAIDITLAQQQHALYCTALEKLGLSVRVLSVSPNSPDCVFIEDTAVILEELAIVCSMGHPARRAEAQCMEPVLRELRDVHRIELPATIDGGDVLRIGKQIYVGLSSRTSAAGAEALRSTAARHGYQTTAIPLRAGLHFKSACTALPDGRILINPEWLDPSSFPGRECVAVSPAEPHAANVLALGNSVIASASYPQTNDQIAALGFDVVTVPLSEFVKADGAVTCLSLIFP